MSKYQVKKRVKLENINIDFERQIELLDSIFSSIIELDNESLELKKLGKKIVVSIKLLHILKINKNIKKVSKLFDELVRELSTNINKFSKVEKMVRNNKFFIPFFITSNNSSLKNTFDIFSNSSIELNFVNDKNFELNDYILNNNFSHTLKKSEKISRINKNSTLVFPYEIIELDRKTKEIFEGMNSRNISEDEYYSISKIIETSKEMYSLYFLNKALENILNIDIENIEIDNKVLLLLKEFIIECDLNYKKYSIQLNEIIKELNDLINDYIKKYSSYDLINFSLPNNLVDMYNNLNKLYYEEKEYSGSFLNYLRQNYPRETEIIDYETKKNQSAINLYSEYLIYKISTTDEKRIKTFDEFIKEKYGINSINIPIRKS